jgi:hypothetical protein
VVFRWEPLAYAAKYQVEVYKNGDTTFSSANRVLSGTVEQAAYAPSDVLAASGSPYVWRVRRIDASNRAGGWSSTGSFGVKGTPPPLISPAKGVYVSGRDAYFTWQAVDAAATYRFERRSAGDNDITEAVTTPGLSWAPTKILGDGAYEWRALAYDTKGSLLGSSAWRQFRVDGTVPTVVRKIPVTTASRTANFVATFSEPVKNFNGTSMALFLKGSQHRLAAKVTLLNGGRTATLNPALNLQVGKTYIVKFLKGVTDNAGNPLRLVSWSVRVR